MHKRAQRAPLGAGDATDHEAYRLIAVLLMLSLLVAGCAKADQDAGSVASLPENVPTLREYQGAQLWLLRRSGDEVVVFWGISPLGAGERGTVRCFIQDRTDRTIRGEDRPFLDACRGACWSRDGRFLGYETDLAGPTPDGAPLIRVPAEVRTGRIYPDPVFLRCLQNREMAC